MRPVYNSDLNIKGPVVMAPNRKLSAQLQYWLEKAYSRSCTYTIEIFTSAFAPARKFYEQVAVWSKIEAWRFTKNKLLKLASSVKTDFICRLTSEHNCSGKKWQKNALVIGVAVKTRGFSYLNVEIWLLLAPIKMSGYVSALMARQWQHRV